MSIVSFKVKMLMVFLMFSGAYGYAAPEVQLSEFKLKELLKLDNPGLSDIEARFLQAQQQNMGASDPYGFRLEGGGEVFKSKERLLNNFDGGVVLNSSQYRLGVVKPTPYGVSVSAEAFGGKTTNAFVSDASTRGVSFKLAIDLFQNFLGRRDLSELNRTKLSLDRAKLEKKTGLKSFEANVRKIYWAMVANNEQLVLMENLVKSAKKQYDESLLRKRSGVADSGEVARYLSQWTTRKASKISLEYQKSSLVRSLKELLPELNGKDVVLAPYSVDAITQNVLSCTSRIQTYVTPPMGNTFYDEIVGFLKEEEKLALKKARTYDDPKIKLTGEYASVGRDFGYQAAQENFLSDPRARQSLGLQISIPLGSRTSDHREVQERLAKKRYQAQIERQLAQLKAYHDETRKTIGLLQQVVSNQKQTNQALTKSLKVSRRKYKQARLSLQELISEEDAKIQSQLDEINTNLTIINTLMDYFSYYPETPCSFNRI